MFVVDGPSSGSQMPRGLNCHICGKPQLSSSLAMHIKSCEQHFLEAQNRLHELIPSLALGPVPQMTVPPPAKRSPQAWLSYNDAAGEVFSRGARYQCPTCSRYFTPWDLIDHFPQCKSLGPSRSSGSSKARGGRERAPPLEGRREAPDSDNRIPCRVCGRKFSPDRIDAHENICRNLRHGPPSRTPARSLPVSGDLGREIARETGTFDSSVIPTEETNPDFSRVVSVAVGQTGMSRERLMQTQPVHQPSQEPSLPPRPASQVSRRPLQPAPEPAQAPPPMQRNPYRSAPAPMPAPAPTAGQITTPRPATRSARVAQPEPVDVPGIKIYVALEPMQQGRRLPLQLCVPEGTTCGDLLDLICGASTAQSSENGRQEQIVQAARKRAWGDGELFPFDLDITDGPGTDLSAVVVANSSADAYIIAHA